MSKALCTAIYLLLHGQVKAVLVWAVLKDQLWANPWMIAFDIFIVWLTWHEYRAHRARRTAIYSGQEPRLGHGAG